MIPIVAKSKATSVTMQQSHRLFYNFNSGHKHYFKKSLL